MSLEEKSITEVVMARDPRHFPWGILTGSSFVLSSSRVFMWFETITELAAHLVNGLPDGYHFDEGYLADFQAKMAPLAQRVEQEGLSDELLSEINATIKADIVIDWWGNFKELTENQTSFAKDITAGFIDEVRAVNEDEMEDFIEYLQTCAI